MKHHNMPGRMTKNNLKFIYQYQVLESMLSDFNPHTLQMNIDR